MTVSVTPSDVVILDALMQFLQSILAPSVEIVRAQDNRVPEPLSADFVVMTPIRRPRLATNVDGFQDVKFTASIAGNVMTVGSIAFGAVLVGATVFGTGIASNTLITGQLTGTVGGTGTYSVNNAQTVADGTASAGNKVVVESTTVVIQLDIHGPNSAENTQAISALFRDEYATSFFSDLAETNGVVSPLHADEPKQIPFINDQQQVEFRWVLEATLQSDFTMLVPQQYADAVTVTTVPVT